MRGVRQGLGWSWIGIIGALGCTHPSPTSTSPTTSPAPELLDAAALSSNGDPVVARIEREIEVHTRRLDHSDPQERSRAQLDLASAYMRRADEQRRRVVELEEQRMVAAEDRRDELDRRIAALRAEQGPWYVRAAQAYQAVLRSSDPEAQRLRSEARFGLAGVRTEQRDHAGACSELEALVRDDPEHALAALARLQLGDDAFAEQRFDDARALYEAVLRSQAARHHPYASYKLGWIALDLGDGELALDHWTRVVMQTHGGPAGDGPSMRALGEEAAKDCVRAFAMTRAPAEAAAFFRQLDRARAPMLLRRLIEHYRDLGQNEAAHIVEVSL